MFGSEEGDHKFNFPEAISVLRLCPDLRKLDLSGMTYSEETLKVSHKMKEVNQFLKIPSLRRKKMAMTDSRGKIPK